ncbi:MAG: GNAT family N-acetyltransferase [Pseudomonadota bacterium]
MGAYPAAVVNAWSGPTPDHRRDAFAETIAERAEIIYVCFEHEQLLGFGSLTPAKAELTAVYVSPNRTRQGVGRLLVDHILTVAADLGLAQLNLDASVNAVPFYASCGFSIVSQGVHTLASGVEMDCVRMARPISRGT